MLTHCGRQPDFESAYCCCIRSVHVSEKEVGRIVVGGQTETVAVRSAAEEVAGLELGVVVPDS